MITNNDNEDELTNILWRLHFTTKRVVDGVVDGVYELPADVVLNLDDRDGDLVPHASASHGRSRGKRMTGHKKLSPALAESATF